MGSNLGEIDQVRIMRHSLENLVNSYNKIKNIAPNSVMDNLADYHASLKELHTNLEKKFKDLK